MNFIVQQYLHNNRMSLDDLLHCPYQKKIRIKNGKARVIYIPTDHVKELSRQLLDSIKVDIPQYVMSQKGSNVIKNAKIHANSLETITCDISHFYPNTKEKYIQQAVQQLLNFSDDDWEQLKSLFVVDGGLVTGSPLSQILGFYAHKKIFDQLNKKMIENNILMTLYVDDITFSSKEHIDSWVIKYTKNILKTHALWLKRSKIKRFGYKQKWVTSVHISQCGKLSAPFCIGHNVVKKLQEKEINKMTLKEVEKLLGEIGYIRNFNKNSFTVTQSRLIKQLKVLGEKL